MMVRAEPGEYQDALNAVSALDRERRRLQGKKTRDMNPSQQSVQENSKAWATDTPRWHVLAIPSPASQARIFSFRWRRPGIDPQAGASL